MHCFFSLPKIGHQIHTSMVYAGFHSGGGGGGGGGWVVGRRFPQRKERGERRDIEGDWRKRIKKSERVRDV